MWKWLICAISLTWFAGSAYAEALVAQAEASGVLPSISVLFGPDYEVEAPPSVISPEEPETYDRTFPFLAQEAIDRGYAPPLPCGLSLLLVENEKLQNIDNVSVNVGKGAVPPREDWVIDVPFVQIEDAVSIKRLRQLRADLSGILSPFTCRVVQFDFSAPFRTRHSGTSTTLALAVEQCLGGYFVAGSASYTTSIFENVVEISIKQLNVGGRLGGSWEFGSQSSFPLCIGAAYFDIDQEVRATTRLAGAFPDGNSLDVR